MLDLIYPNKPEHGDAVTINGVRVAVLVPDWNTPGGWLASTDMQRPRPTHTRVESREVGRERLGRWLDANAARLHRETYREPVRHTSRLDEPFRLE